MLGAEAELVRYLAHVDGVAAVVTGTVLHEAYQFSTIAALRGGRVGKTLPQLRILVKPFVHQFTELADEIDFANSLSPSTL